MKLRVARSLLVGVLAAGACLPAAAQLEGVIDVHVHAAPDGVPRSIDALETARRAAPHRMRALLFENHYRALLGLHADGR